MQSSRRLVVMTYSAQLLKSSLDHWQLHALWNQKKVKTLENLHPGMCAHRSKFPMWVFFCYAKVYFFSLCSVNLNLSFSFNFFYWSNGELYVNLKAFLNENCLKIKAVRWEWFSFIFHKSYGMPTNDYRIWTICFNCSSSQRELGFFYFVDSSFFFYFHIIYMPYNFPIYVLAELCLCFRWN